MELRQLQYFRRVAEARSMNRAASALHMTQPSLSRQIMALERELGERLFERTPRGVELTPAGRSLHQHLTSVFVQLEAIPEVVRTAGAGAELIRLGVPIGLPHDWVRTTLLDPGKGIRLSLQEATTEEQRILLQDGQLDLGLIHVDAPELQCIRLFSQPLGICLPAESRLAERTTVTFSDLDGLRVMAHAVGEVNAEVDRLRTASRAAGVETNWLFRRFSEHSSLIALFAEVDAVLITETSATRHFPTWVWIPIRRGPDQDERTLEIGTWVAHRHSTRRSVLRLVERMRQSDRAAHLER